VSPQFDFFGIVVSDMARSVAFYRLLGLDFPEGAETESHVEAPLPGGLRYALDTEEVMRSVGRLLGHAVRAAEGPGRHGDRPVRAAPDVVVGAV
jgi:hypothetical protein